MSLIFMKKCAFVPIRWFMSVKTITNKINRLDIKELEKIITLKNSKIQEKIRLLIWEDSSKCSIIRICINSSLDRLLSNLDSILINKDYFKV